MSGAHDPRITPVAIELVGTRGMEVEWEDGHRSRFDADFLRAECPCATCRQEKTGHGDIAITIGAPLPLLPKRARGGMELAQVEPVGYYGIRITFSDDHASGIFAFDLLRGLDRGAEGPAAGAAPGPPPTTR